MSELKQDQWQAKMDALSVRAVYHRHVGHDPEVYGPHWLDFKGERRWALSSVEGLPRAIKMRPDYEPLHLSRFESAQLTSEFLCLAFRIFSRYSARVSATAPRKVSRSGMLSSRINSSA